MTILLLNSIFIYSAYYNGIEFPHIDLINGIRGKKMKSMFEYNDTKPKRTYDTNYNATNWLDINCGHSKSVKIRL